MWYKEEAFAHHEGTTAVVLIMMLYGWATIPFVYTVSFSFKNPGNACAKLVVMLIFLSICPTVLVTVTSDKGEITSRSCLNSALTTLVVTRSEMCVYLPKTREEMFTGARG